MADFKHQPWYQFLDEGMQDLVNLASFLLEKFSSVDSVNDLRLTIHDYSFVVFPMAKAYEGFLKKMVFY